MSRSLHQLGYLELIQVIEHLSKSYPDVVNQAIAAVTVLCSHCSLIAKARCLTCGHGYCSSCAVLCSRCIYAGVANSCPRCNQLTPSCNGETICYRHCLDDAQYCLTHSKMCHQDWIDQDCQVVSEEHPVFQAALVSLFSRM